MQTLDQPPPTTVVSSAFYLPKSGRFGDGLILDDQLLQVLPPTIELLDYFRQRVSDFEKLEEDYVARIEALADSAPGTSLVIDRDFFPSLFVLFYQSDIKPDGNIFDARKKFKSYSQH
jgi:hypothetical protein